MRLQCNAAPVRRATYTYCKDNLFSAQTMRVLTAPICPCGRSCSTPVQENPAGQDSRIERLENRWIASNTIPIKNRIQEI